LGLLKETIVMKKGLAIAMYAEKDKEEINRIGGLWLPG